MRTILTFIVAFFLVVTMCLKFFQIGYHAAQIQMKGE